MSRKLPAPAKSPKKRGIKGDLGNIILLVILYLLQGVPLGLCFGSIPFLLKSRLSFSDLAIFSLSSYPYSVKLLWSPFVDSYYLKSVGRRKSWIIPTQLLIGATLIFLGLNIDEFLNLAQVPITQLTIAFTFLIFLCATQDIAVDGWALTLLNDDNKTYGSTAQTIGLNTGYFVSFTVFLAFNSAEFSNKYLRSTPLDHGLFGLGSYLIFWGIVFLLCDVWLILFKTETMGISEIIDDVGQVYKTVWQVFGMEHMQSLLVLLLIAKVGFIANESVTGLKLLEMGFSKEDLALSVLVDFPLQLVFGYYAAKWSSGSRPLRPWLYAFYGRLFFAALGMYVVYIFPKTGVTSSYFILVLVLNVMSSFMSTVQFVGLGSYFTTISDPLIGGTYMTLLNTINNLGGTWPRYFVLKAVESYTIAPCVATDKTLVPNIKCSDDVGKAACTAAQGTCQLAQDGYYIVGSFCVAFGVLSLILYIQPMVKRLEAMTPAQWKLESKNK